MINQNDHDDQDDHDQRGGDSQGGSAWPCKGAEEAAGCWGAGQILLPSNLVFGDGDEKYDFTGRACWLWRGKKAQLPESHR